ncbi:unnamed protein product, partial [Ixodes pacificus]
TRASIQCRRVFSRVCGGSVYTHPDCAGAYTRDAIADSALKERPQAPRIPTGQKGCGQSDAEPQISQGPLSLEAFRGTSRHRAAWPALIKKRRPAPFLQQLAKSGSRFPTSSERSRFTRFLD